MTSEAINRQAQAGTSPWVALLPLGFIAVGIGAIGFAASLSVRARPTPVLAAPAPTVPARISPREEARLAEQITAFALAKVAPERFEVDLRDVGQRPAEASRTNAKLAPRKASERPPVKVATVLPPPRPAIIAASVPSRPQPAAVVASVAPPPALIPVGFVPPVSIEPETGVLARIANYVPSPRRILSDAVSDAWSLGGKVGRLIPGI